MSDIRIITGVSSVTRATADAQFLGVRGMRDGAIVQNDWLMALMMEGRGFVANVGTLTAPITGTAGAPDNLQPDAAIRVPSGTTMIPVSIEFTGEASAGTLNELIIGVGDADLGNGTSTAATAGPTAVRPDSPISALCVARQEYTGNGSAYTNFYEFARWSNASEPLDVLRWAAGSWAPVLVGPSTLYMHFAATTTGPTGYASLVWVEVPSTSVV